MDKRVVCDPEAARQFPKKWFESEEAAARAELVSAEAMVKLLSPGMDGVMSTAGGLVFGGTEEGNFFALDAATGKPLWDMQLGGPIHGNPMSFGVDGKQYVAIPAGWTLYVFAVP